MRSGDVGDKANNDMIDKGAFDDGRIKNEIKETRAPKSRIGICIGAETRHIRCEGNQIEGCAIPIKDLHNGG